MICISDSFTFKASCFIEERDGVRVDSGEKMKVLGWHFSTSPTVDVYIAVLSRWFRQRYWTIRYLKHIRFTNEDLVKVYIAIVRPVANYMMEVCHSMMYNRLDEQVEHLQLHAWNLE